MVLNRLFYITNTQLHAEMLPSLSLSDNFPHDLNVFFLKCAVFLSSASCSGVFSNTSVLPSRPDVKYLCATNLTALLTGG